MSYIDLPLDCKFMLRQADDTKLWEAILYDMPSNPVLVLAAGKTPKEALEVFAREVPKTHFDPQKYNKQPERQAQDAALISGETVALNIIEHLSISCLLLYQRMKQVCDRMRKSQETIMLNDGTKFTLPDATTMRNLDAIDEQLAHLSSRCDWS